MADTWGGISRAMEEGLERRGGGSYSDRMHEEMYPGHRQAAREANAHGLIGLLSGRHRAFIDDNKSRMRELGINPSHRDREGNLTGRYSSGDWAALQDALAGDQAVTTGLGPENRPVGVPITGEINQAIQENAPWQERSPIDPAILSQLRREPAWTDRPRSGIQNRFGNREFTPRTSSNPMERRFDRTTSHPTGAIGYLPGRMSVGEARRARDMRNMSRRDREAAGLGNLERFDEFGRISEKFDKRLGRLQDTLRDWDIQDRVRRPGVMGGGPSTRIQPDWAALEEDMARQAMRDEFIGRDDR